ncbi:MAG TPA: hypothetical protein VM580_27735 [Labilithrix sp.]|nr:hypothetical protein [Labilithrix sp.]
MVSLATLAIGFAAGWTARGTSATSRSAALAMIATLLAAFDRIKRGVAIEKDLLEDLYAEARARADIMGQERAARHRGSNDANEKNDRMDEAAA